MFFDTTTATAAPSCRLAVLPGVSVPSGGMYGASCAKSLKSGATELWSRASSGLARNGAISPTKRLLFARLLSLEVRAQGIGILLGASDAVLDC